MRMIERLTDTPSQKRVGGGDDRALCFLLDTDDPGERMFQLGLLLLISSQIEDILSMAKKISAFDRDHARSPIFVDTSAGGAERLVSVSRARVPSPPAFVEDGAALRTGRWFGKLTRCLVPATASFLKVAMFSGLPAPGRYRTFACQVVLHRNSGCE